MDFGALVQDKKDGRCKITVPKRFKELEQPTHFRLDTKAPGSVETEVGSSGSGVDGAAKFIVGAWLHFRNPSVALTCCFAVSSLPALTTGTPSITGLDSWALCECWKKHLVALAGPRVEEIDRQRSSLRLSSRRRLKSNGR